MDIQSSGYVEYILACPTWQEAQRIADSLLEKHLIGGVEFIDIKSKSLFQQATQETKEIKLIMQSLSTNLAEIEAEITKLHSYQTFALQTMPVPKLPSAAEKWLNTAIKTN